MIGAPSAIELEGFERLEATPGTALLRIAARASAGTLDARRVTLVVHHGRRGVRLSPLPAPPDRSGMLRLAYSAPLALVDQADGFALELVDGSILELPTPTLRAAAQAA